VMSLLDDDAFYAWGGGDEVDGLPHPMAHSRPLRRQCLPVGLRLVFIMVMVNDVCRGSLL
jgi:hypothetical protein